jgi:hypothetical protein
VRQLTLLKTFLAKCGVELISTAPAFPHRDGDLSRETSLNAFILGERLVLDAEIRSASPSPSRAPTHGSGPMWIATPSNRPSKTVVFEKGR